MSYNICQKCGHMLGFYVDKESEAVCDRFHSDDPNNSEDEYVTLDEVYNTIQSSRVTNDFKEYKENPGKFIYKTPKIITDAQINWINQHDFGVTPCAVRNDDNSVTLSSIDDKITTNDFTNVMAWMGY